MKYEALWAEHGVPADAHLSVSLIFVGAGLSCALVPGAPDLEALGIAVKSGVGAAFYDGLKTAAIQWHRERTNPGRPAREVNLEVMLEYCYDTGKNDELTQLLKAIVPAIHHIETTPFRIDPTSTLQATLGAAPGIKILVSFNYDTVLERLLGWKNYGVTWQYATKTLNIDGLRIPSVVTDLDSQVRGNHSKGTRTSMQFPYILVLKPHGSLNWTQYLNEDNGQSLVVITKESHQNFFDQVMRSSKPWAFDCATDAQFTRRKSMVVPPMPQKSPGPDITFYHFRLMLEALRKADSVVSLGWSCPISDRNLLDAIKFQFWEREEPLRKVTGVWRYPFGDPLQQIIPDRFKSMFPALHQDAHFDGIDRNTMHELLDWIS